MAISSSPNRGGDDPVLDRLATTNTFESDWPTLRQHLHIALLSSLPLFLSRGPPRPYRPPQSPTILGPEPIKIESATSETPEEQADQKPPSESLLLSPSQPSSSSTGAAENIHTTTTPQNASTRSQVDATPRSLDAEPTATPALNRFESLHTEDDLQPSTPGGLVIAPFPPLDPERRRRSSFEAGPSTAIPTVIGAGPRMNGMRGQRPLQLGPAVVDEAYDEDVVIGGKMLPSWLDEQEGKKELERVVKMLDELDAPPFTIQRLAELLLQPTQYHTTLGKFLRAVEKTLLVNTPWEPPSYTPAPLSLIPTRASVPGGSSASSSDNGYDSDSTMPPGSTTPMFSPIPFLTHQESDELGLTLDGLANGTGSGRSLDDGLMSPLMLSETSGMFGSAANPRSPTPEPEETEGEPSSVKSTNGHGQGDGDTEMGSGDDAIESVQVETDTISGNADDLPPRPSAAQGQYESIEHSDPAHQSYLGRVDELDTGPITPTASTSVPNSSTLPPSDSHLHKKRPDEVVPLPGTGEGGNLTPHGMSEKPVPISSTTVVKDEKGERNIAGLPRSTSEKSLRDRFVSAGSKSPEGEAGNSNGDSNGDSAKSPIKGKSADSESN
ncbi:hypothetical protein IAT40_006784 [Kwoniella sp. CBS 6097]